MSVLSTTRPEHLTQFFLIDSIFRGTYLHTKQMRYKALISGVLAQGMAHQV